MPLADKSAESLKNFVEQSLDADKAEDICVIKMDDQSALADYMIVASGTSSRHVLAMASKIKDRLAAGGYKNIRLEGAEQGDWVILDLGDVLIHLFRPEVRMFYNIEKMWGHGAGFDIAGGTQSA